MRVVILGGRQRVDGADDEVLDVEADGLWVGQLRGATHEPTLQNREKWSRLV